MATDNNFRVKNGVIVGNGSVATNTGTGLNLTGPSIGIVSTSTQDIDLYTNNFTGNGVEVWLRHNDGVEINTDNGGKSWKFFPDGHTRFATVFAIDTISITTGSGLLAVIEDRGSKLAYYSTTACNWLYVGTEEIVYTPVIVTPPVTDYIGWYDMTSVDLTGGYWNDMSGNAYNATASGSPTITSGTGNGATATFSALTGITSDKFIFPSAILPSTYTLFHVTRYNGSNQQRIFTDTSAHGGVWLSGHHDHKGGVAYHGGWVNTPTDYYGSNWVISSDQNYFYRPNGNTSDQGTAGSGNYVAGLTLNGKSDEASDWQCAEVIVYNRTLSGTEISDTESYLATKYGITLG